MEKYGGFLEELSGASSDQMRGMLARLVKDAPLSYHMLLRNRLFRKLASYVFGKTRFLPANARMSTRCWYVINNIDEVICCHNCGKPLPRDIKITEKSKVFWCGPGCQGEDPYMRNQLSKIRTGRKN